MGPLTVGTPYFSSHSASSFLSKLGLMLLVITADVGLYLLILRVSANLGEEWKLAGNSQVSASSNYHASPFSPSVFPPFIRRENAAYYRSAHPALIMQGNNLPSHRKQQSKGRLILARTCKILPMWAKTMIQLKCFKDEASPGISVVVHVEYMCSGSNTLSSLEFIQHLRLHEMEGSMFEEKVQVACNSPFPPH